MVTMLQRAAPAIRRRCRRRFRAGLFLWTALSAGAVPVSAQRPVDLHTFRFWRPGDVTLVEAYASVPLSLLTFSDVAGSDQRQAVTSGTLEVRDSAGLVLTREAWVDTIRLPALTQAALLRTDAAQHFTFQVTPGRYAMRVQVTDAATQQTWTAEKALEGYAVRPAQSDLVLASDLIRTEEGTPSDPNAMIRGRLGVLPNFTGAISPENARIAVYTEIYRPDMPAESAQARIALAGRNSTFGYVTPPQTRIYPTGIASEAFALDLTGLPIGSYDLKLQIGLAGDTLEAMHPLEMLPPGAGALQVAEAVLFQDFADAQLDTLFAPMRYIATDAEEATFAGLSSGDAKRRFLNRFWQARAAEAGESVSRLVRDWLDRVQYVNRDFRPTIAAQGGRQGWQTDRGRIYLRYGPPAERAVAHQLRLQEVKGCEMWQYTAGRGDRYVFFDLTGFGDYDLVYSTDRTEPGIPGYETLFQDGKFTCK